MEKFLNKIFNFKNQNRFNPFLLKGMDEALNRLIKAVNEREKILIYGYYDLDGITAISLMVLILKYLNADVEYFIPETNNLNYEVREEDFNDKIKYLGANLLITVGCGVNSISAVQYCKEIGIDVIITDNHQCKEKLTEAIVIDPNQTGCLYPFKDLTGVGIAFKLVEAISQYYGMKRFNKYMDLVMIGTISKKPALIGENKVIIDEGIERLQKSNNYGIKALIKVFMIHPLTMENIASSIFDIIPKVRLSNNTNIAKIVVELFTSADAYRSEQIAKYLNNEINYRKICM